MTPTPCEDCDMVHSDTRKLSPHRWRCVKFPVLPGFNAVAPSWQPDPPYARCAEINHGLCPVFKPRRMPDDIQP